MLVRGLKNRIGFSCAVSRVQVGGTAYMLISVT